MRNLCRFCHYHHGTPHEKSVKIVGSFLIVAMLAAVSAGFTNAVYAQQEGAIMAPPPGEPPSMPFPKPPGRPEVFGEPGRPEIFGEPGRPQVFPPRPGDERSPGDKPVVRPRLEVRPGENRIDEPRGPEGVRGPEGPRETDRSPQKPGDDRRDDRRGPPQSERSGEGGSESVAPSESSGEGEGQMMEDQRDFVDPNEIKQVLRQFADMKRELSRFAKTKGLAQSDKDAIAAILKRVVEFEAALKKDSSRDTLQEFYDAQIWEEIQQLRGRIELPKELKMIERELAKTKKLTAIKTFQKSFLVLKFDMEIVKGHLAEVEKALADAKAAYDQGNFEDAFEALQPIHEGMHPGSIQGIMQRLREAGNQIGRIRDAKVRGLFIELLEPIVESAKEGDYNGAHQIMNEIEPELRRLMNQAFKVRAKDIGSLQTKLDALEELIGKKVDARDEASEKAEGQGR